MRTIITLLISLIASVLSPLDAQTINFSNKPLKEVLDIAGRQNKLIFVDCYAEWCGPCKWMDKNIFTNDTVISFYNENFVNLKLDMEKGEGKEFSAKYKIKAYPSFVFLNAKAELIYMIVGAKNVKDFIQLGKDALNPNNQLISFKESYAKGDHKSNFIYQYCDFLEKSGMPYEHIAEKYLTQLKFEDRLDSTNLKILIHFIDEPDSPPFQEFVLNPKQSMAILGNEAYETIIVDKYTKNLNRLIFKKDFETYNHRIKQLRELNLKHGEETIIRSEILMYDVKEDFSGFAETSVKYLENYPSKEWELLNNLAWSFYEKTDNKEYLEIAIKWIEQSIKIEENSLNTDTYAALLYKLGRYGEAKTIAEKSIKYGKEEGLDLSETEKLLENINKKIN